jgi:hypothetical protein
MKPGEKVYVDLGGIGPAELIYIGPAHETGREGFKYHNGKVITLIVSQFPELQESFKNIK